MFFEHLTDNKLPKPKHSGKYILKRAFNYNYTDVIYAKLCMLTFEINRSWEKLSSKITNCSRPTFVSEVCTAIQCPH